MTHNKGWVLSDYKKAFERFKDEHNDYPNSIDIDSCDYMPTSRTIQRQFGGLVQLKNKLGIEETDHRSGIRRSRVASFACERNLNSEIEMLKLLKQYYSDIQIHREDHYIENSSKRSDFGVYLKDSRFFIDVFFPSSKRSLVGSINWKLTRVPKQFNSAVYFVVMNNEIKQEDIDGIVSNKKNEVAKNISIVSFATFKNILSGLNV